MTIREEDLYRLYAHIGSPYSMKMRAVLRYRRIPHAVMGQMSDWAHAFKQVRVPVMPVLEYPVPATPSLPNDLPEGVTPGQVGVQAWDLPGIGRIASECSHRCSSSRPLPL